jgi:hypothetical protein
MPKKLVSKN